MNSDLPGAVCIDCLLSDDSSGSDPKIPLGHFCKHWRPEFWESRGYLRNWGDAAVMNWPHMEILRSEERSDDGTQVSFVILAPYAMRRPVVIRASTPGSNLHAWGSY